MSTICIVRHGEAENGADDSARRLTPRGRNEVEKIAEWARETGVAVDEIVHSGKRRAEETAEIFARELRPPRGARAMPGLKPDDDVRPFANELVGEEPNVMVVGHLPFVGRLVNWLTMRDEGRPIVDFATATLVKLQGEHGEYRIVAVMRPDMKEDG